MTIDRDLAAVRDFVRPYLVAAGARAEVLAAVDPARDASAPLPLAGGQAWCKLPGDDPRKLAAVLLAGLAWVADATTEAVAARQVAELLAACEEPDYGRLAAMLSGRLLKASSVAVCEERQRQRRVLDRLHGQLDSALGLRGGRCWVDRRRVDKRQVDALLDRLAGWQWADDRPVVT